MWIRQGNNTFGSSSRRTRRRTEVQTFILDTHHTLESRCFFCFFPPAHPALTCQHTLDKVALLQTSRPIGPSPTEKSQKKLAANLRPLNTLQWTQNDPFCLSTLGGI